MENKKLLAASVLFLTLAATGATFASTGTTDTSTGNTQKERPELTDEQKAEFEAIKVLLDKQKAGETLTTEEQATLDAFKAKMPEKGEGRGPGGERGEGRGGELFGGGFGGGFGGDKLTDEEKTALESMTDDEKKAFFETKRAENEAKSEARETVIDKLLAGETLTADEENVKQEIITQRAEMKAKKAEFEEIRTLMEKQKNGETLTTEEQAKLDAFKTNMPGKGEGRGFGGKGGFNKTEQTGSTNSSN